MACRFLQSTLDATAQSTYTFSSQNIGAAAANRYVVATGVARKAGASTTLTSVTINGVAATIVKQVTNTGANTTVVWIAIASVPAGTSVTVTVVYGASMVRSTLALYRLENISTPIASDSQSSTASAPTCTLNVPVGCAIGVAAVASSGSWSWSGLTEDYDASGSSLQYTGASKTFITANASQAITATYTGTNTEPAGVFASWAHEPALQSRFFQSA